METRSIAEPVQLSCVKAPSFPDGIMEAWQQLHALLPEGFKGTMYGVSWGAPEGGVTYLAGVDARAIKIDAPETFTVRAGKYISKTLPNWRSDTTVVGKTFEEMLKDPRLDPKGYCLEIYHSMDEVECLTKIVDE